MATLSQFNNTNVPLLAGQTFTGAWERSLRNLEVTCFLNSSSYALLTIEQSVDASNVRIPTSFNYTPTTEVSTFSVSIGLPFFRVKLLNVDIGTQAYLSLNTYLIPTPPQQVQVNGTVEASITGVVDVSGNVVATNLITETLATRRVDFLVVGDWYRVASVGLTSGAEWNQIGAIVDGESVPAIGRLFKCLQVGSAVAGGGTCYDVEYNTNAITLADPTTVRIKDSFGDPILTTSGNLMCGISNIYTANPLHTIVDSGVVGIDSGNNLVSVNDSSTITVTSVTNALPAGTNVLGLVGLDITGGANTIAISQNGTDNVVAITGTVEVSQINGALPSGANTIGVCGIDVALNTIKIDPANNQVSLASSSTSTFLSASNTGQTVKNSAGVLLGLFINSDGVAGTNYVKLYNVASPTFSDTPLMVITVPNATFYNIDTWNTSFSTAIGLRVTAGSSNADNNAPTNLINVTTFFR